MPDYITSFRPRSRGQRKSATQIAETPEEQQSLLASTRDFGLAGLHTVGSLLSTVSRGTHGTINALTGGEGGFGNLDPIDSTGGIEGSRHFERLGLLAKNDPTKWEWRDPVAGVADIALDPLTYKFGVGLVMRAIKGASYLTGITKAGKAIAASKVGQAVASKVLKPALAETRGVADWRVGGKTHEDLADQMETYIRGVENSERAARATTSRLGRERIASGHIGPDSEDSFRMAAEGVDPSRFANTGPFDPSHPHVTELVAAKNAKRAEAQFAGVSHGLDDLNDIVGHFPRQLSESSVKSFWHDERKLSLKGFHRGTTGVNELLADPGLHAAITAAGSSRGAIRAAALSHIESNYAHLIERGITLKSGKVVDRYKRLATKIADSPSLTKGRLFGNDPYSDFERYITRIDKRVLASEPVYESIKRNLAKGGVADGVPVGRFLKQMGYSTNTAAGKIAEKLGMNALDPLVIKSVKGMRFDQKLAEQLADMAPGFKAPLAVDRFRNIRKFWKSGMRFGKAYTLSMPKSRMRDAIGGVVRNLLDGGGHYGDAKSLLAGRAIARSADDAIPEIADWLTKSGKAPTPENVTEAFRQLGGVHFGDSGFMNDLPAGQVGRSITDVTGDVLGQQKTTPFRQAFLDPLMTTFGRGPDPDVRWTGHGYMNPVTGIRGVGDTTKTTMPFINAAEQVAGYSDQVNRMAPFIQRLRRGESADAAREAVNAAQVNYSHTRMTPSERGLRDNFIPFYGFAKGSAIDTANQLLKPFYKGAKTGMTGTAQFINATDRAYGNDPRVPDYIQSGSSIPLNQLPDGTLRYLTGAGLMHEDATKRIGQILGGDTVGLGYGAASMLNPLIKTPAERTTQQVFHQRGAPISQAEPTVGRTLANIGEITGLRNAPADGSYNPPVKYTGDKYVDTLMSMMPFGVLGSTARQATDTRRGIGDVLVHGQEKDRTTLGNAASIATGLAPLLTGLQITDISPNSQTNTLRKNAERIARDAGAKTFQNVYFSEAELARLKQTDPELYKKQMQLQGILKKLNRKKK